MKSIVKQLEFNHHSVDPDFSKSRYEDFIILKKGNGYHVAYPVFDMEYKEFLGFYDFTGEKEYKPGEFYIAWAQLPCDIDVSSEIVKTFVDIHNLKH